MKKIFIVSDCHFNHSMLIREEKREFKDIGEMNSVIIKNWNRLISSEDTVYNLGDVALNNKMKFDEEIKPILNGNIIYIKGNHDPVNISHIKSMIITFKGKTFELIHNPFEATLTTDYIIHGHLHGNTERIGMIDGKKCYNCVVELNKYRPKNISEILGELENYNEKKYLAVPV